jgi:hypothetical protein
MGLDMADIRGTTTSQSKNRKGSRTPPSKRGYSAPAYQSRINHLQQLTQQRHCAITCGTIQVTHEITSLQVKIEDLIHYIQMIIHQ